LVFLVYPVVEVLEHDSPAMRAVGLTLLATYAVVYLLGWGLWHEHALKIWFVMLALLLATMPVIGIGAIALTPYLGVFSAVMLPAPWWRWTTAFTALLPFASLIEGDFPVFFFLMVWPIIGFSTAMRVFAEFDEQAGQARSALALVAERERVARDVHDVLGHSLTALSIKAELASRLIEADPARAKAELESIQATARQALAEIRATVGGLRASNLEAELAAAPQVLADAGVDTQLVGGVADTDPRHRALLAWILRESVTNVVRHAAARSVVIELGEHGMTITDDGAGLHGREGNGLRGMRERISGAGGTLQVDDAEPGTRVQVVLP
jgi:two-component system sensor histidine kinase DesK